LVTWLAGKVDWVYLDRLNYVPNFRSLYRQAGREEALTDSFFQKMKTIYVGELKKRNIRTEILF
jgi:ABC-type uncharacterized transport system ATPase subunit